MPERIKQPKNESIKMEKAQLNLVWSQTFGADRTTRFTSAQKFVDSECIRLMVPYTPMLNGILMKSPVLGTKIGSGHIYYLNPYARYQYYGKLMVSSITGSAFASMGEKKVLTGTDLNHQKSRHPQAGPFWFDRMKSEKASQILRGAAKLTGGTPIG